MKPPLHTCADCAHFVPFSQHPRSVGQCLTRGCKTSAITVICNLFKVEKEQRKPARVAGKVGR